MKTTYTSTDEERERLNAIVPLPQPRLNAGTGLYHEGAPVNYEALRDGLRQHRYIDPLIRDKIHDKKNATHRDRVAAEDPLGILITRMFSLLGWSRAPKFYESDEKGAPEVMQDIRMLLQALHLGDQLAEGTFEVVKHGWTGVYMWQSMDENMQPTIAMEVYSASQIGQEDIIRDKATAYQMALQDEMEPNVLQSIMNAPANAPLVWIVRGRYPVIPAGYSTTNIKPQTRHFYAGQPGWVVHTRGDFNKTLGYGYSRLVDNWDSITKLRSTSHADAKRTEIFPVIVYPSSWDGTQVKDLFTALAHVDETSGLAVMSGKDSEGNPTENLPSIVWRSPASDAPGTSSEGGPRGLPGELMRFCALTGITIKELAGDPGGAQEAGQVDYAQALEKNIQEFNTSARGLLEKMLKMLVLMGLLPAGAIPESFTVKGHWEWERDEMMAQQEAMVGQQMENETRDSESKEKAAESKPKQNVAVEWHDVVESPVEAGYLLDAVLRENAVQGVMAPITSSWVKSYGYDQDNFYLQFHGAGSTIFKYPYTDNPQALAQGMESSGSPGGFVHDNPELGVPRRTPYEKVSQLPDTMAWWEGSQALTEYTSEEESGEKKAHFGKRRPATTPNPSGYKHMTDARTEQTEGGSGTLGGTAVQGPVNLMGLLSKIRAMPRSIPTGDQWVQSQVTPAGTNQTPASQPTQTRPLALVPGQRDFGPGTGPGAPSKEWNPTWGDKRTKKTKAAAATNMPDYGFSYVAPNVTNAAPIDVPRINASVADLSYEDWQAASREVNSGQGFNETTIRKVMKVVQASQMVERANYRARGNSMSFKDHPYVYRGNDGTLSVEYPCAKDWRQNVVGQGGKHKNEYEDPNEHGDTFVGTITYGWDEKQNCPADVLEYDREAVMRELEKHDQTSSPVYLRLKAGEDPDISTEYMCHVETHNGKRWQRGFKPSKRTGRFDSCLVNHGNCPSGQCDFAAAEGQD